MQRLDPAGKIWTAVRKLTSEFAGRPIHSHFINYQSVIQKLDQHAFPTPSVWYNHVCKLYQTALDQERDDLSKDILMQISYEFEKTARYLDVDTPTKWCLNTQDMFSKADALMKSCPYPFLINPDLASFIEANADHFPPRPVHLEQARQSIKHLIKVINEPSPTMDVSNFYLGAFREKLIDINNFQNIRPLGSGTYARVELEEEMTTNKLVAMKYFTGDQISERQISIFCREVSILAMYPHQSLLPFYGFTNRDRDDYPALIIATEYMPHGTLRDMLDLEKSGKAPSIWNNTQKSIVAFNIACGLRFLHQRSVIHRDLKSMNILMDEMYEPRIADMGYAKVISDGEELTMRIGTCLWMAPEVITSHSYDFSADVYSFAMVLYEMITLKMPFEGSCSTPIQVHEKVLSGVRPELPKGQHRRLCKLIEKCWSACPEERPTFAQIVEKFMSGKCLFDDTDLETFHAAVLRMDNDDFKMDVVVAVQNNFFEVVRSMVRNPAANLNTVDEVEGRSAVHFAVINDQPEMLQLLLTAPRLDVNKSDKFGKTALHYAAEKKDGHCLRLLLTRDDLNVNCRDTTGSTPIFTAIREMNDQAVLLLLSRLDTNINIVNSKKETPLTLAIVRNAKSILAKLVTTFRVRMDIPQHRRLLKEAFIRHKIEAIHLLLMIPNININEAIDGETPLSIAVKSHDEDMIMPLLENPKLDLSPERISPLLMEGLRCKDLLFLRLLLVIDRVDLNFSSENLVPPLILAVFLNNNEAISLMIHSPKIDVNVQEYSSGHTALHFAVQSGKPDIVKLLMTSPKVNPKIKNASGQTPADLAGKSSELIRALKRN